MDYFVSLLASHKGGTLCVGVTRDLVRRVYEHKTNAVLSFTSQYAVHDLVWYESTNSVAAAIAREKQLKNWRREWKVALIESSNPGWNDLYSTIVG